MGISACNLTDTLEQVITVNNTAKPTIQGLMAEGGTRFCPGDKIQFNIRNSWLFDSIYWDFGDGTFSTEQSPSHAYATMGGKRIIATVWNICGNSASDTTYVQIYNNIGVNPGFWWNTDGDMCPGNQVIFYPNGTGNFYLWDFGDGETSQERMPTHFYADTGKYQAKLIVKNNCGFADTSIKNVLIHYNPGNRPYAHIAFKNTDDKIFSKKVCPNEEVYFSNWTGGSGGISYRWDFGDGDSAITKETSHHWKNSGTYYVIMTARNNCMGISKDTLQVIVDASTPAVFPFAVLQQEICPGETMYFIPQNHEGGLEKMKFSLYYGDGSSDLNLTEGNNPYFKIFSHTYTKAGTYYIRIDATNLCNNTATVFRDTLTVSNAVANPYYLVSNSATRMEDPTFALIPDLGKRRNSTDFQLTIPVYWPGWQPGYDSTFAVIVSKQPFQGGDISLIGWIKMKGQGNATLYIPAGPDSVYLGAVWMCDGMFEWGNSHAFGTYKKGIIPVPSGSLTLTFPDGIAMQTEENWNGNCDDRSACPGDTVVFMAIGGMSYKWNFGDGSQEVTGQLMKHVYTEPGKYNAYVVITNGCGKKDTLYTTAKVGSYRKPTEDIYIDMGSDQFCVGDSIFFNKNAWGGEDDPLRVNNEKYFWDFGDGHTSTERRPVHVYEQAGKYMVKYKVSNHCGDTTVSRDIFIDGPKIMFSSPTIVKQNEPVPFTNQTINAVSYEWSFGNDSVSIKRDPVVRYPLFGQYTVTLKATNARGCKASLTKPNYITVLKTPVITDVQITQVSCFGKNDGAIDITIAGGEPPFTYSWSNGASTQDISKLAVGSYTVTVTDKNGTVVKGTYNITQPTPLTIPPLVKTNESCLDKGNGSLTANPSGGTPPYLYQWSNGATTQTITNLTHGRYSVTVTDANKCEATQSDTIMAVKNKLISSAYPTVVPACGNSTGAVTVNVVVGGPYSFLWNTSPTQSTQTTTATLPAGAYKVIVTDIPSGCKDSAIVPLGNTGTTLQATVTERRPVTCYGKNNGSVTITAWGGTGSYSFLWNNGQTTATATGLKAGFWWVTVTDGAGCKVTLAEEMTQPKPMSLSFITKPASCPNAYDGSATAIVTGGVEYPNQWNRRFLWSNMWDQPENINIPPDTYSVTVTDNNDPSCRVTGNVTVTSLPEINITANIYHVQVRDASDGAINTTIHNGTPPYTYEWTWADGSSYSQDIEGIKAGNYTFKVTDAKQCKKSATYTITQPAMLTSTHITANRSFPICWGEKAELDGGAGYVKYEWTANIPEFIKQTTRKITVDTAMRVYLKAYTNTTYGIDSMDIKVHYPYNEHICMVTVDSATGKNKIIWEKTPFKNTLSYNVYKIVGSNYQLIGNVPYGNLTVFNDMSSSPEKNVDRYVITAVDSCGHESAISPYHETMLLGAAKGTSIYEAVLNWNKYVDESGRFVPEYYYIYRGKSKRAMELIDSISGILPTSYNDQGFDGTYAYYMIGVRNPHACDPAGLLKAETGPYTQSLSNIVEYKIANPENIAEENTLNASAYPNPFTSHVIIEVPLGSTSDVLIETINATGQKTASFVYKNLPAGVHRIRLSREAIHIAAGIVYIKVIANDRTSVIINSAL